MSTAPEKKITVKTPSSVEYRQYLARVRTSAGPSVSDAFNKAAVNQGVMIGQWQPKDRSGNSLGKTFNVFAAPEDLTDEAGKKVTLTYDNAVKRLAELKDWHGFDGSNFANDTAVYDALKKGNYNGGWFIPTQDILKKNILPYKDDDALNDTFSSAAAEGSNCPDWFMSCTENHGISHDMYFINLSVGSESWFLKDNLRVSCRPVRLVEVAGPA